MVILRFLLIFGLICPAASAQKHDYQWLMGEDIAGTPYLEKEGLINWDFNFPNGPKLTRLQRTDMYFVETNASISDSVGQLQCYSNGIKVFAPNHKLMANGDSITPVYRKRGYPQPQGALILPYPKRPEGYLILNKRDQIFSNFGATSALLAATIDMQKNNGNGKVLEKREIIIEDTLDYGKLTAVRHANGRDWWIIQPERSTNRFYRLYLEPQGLKLKKTQTVGISVERGDGQMIFTPDGTKMIRSKHTFLEEPGQVDIYDFDRCGGFLSNQRTIIRDYEGFKFGIGVSCSPDSRYLYVTQALYTYQYDLTAPDIAATETIVGTDNEFVSAFYPAFFGLSQLAPDGRIYVSTVNGSYHWSYIKHPTRAGTACGFVRYGINLTVLNQIGIPNHPNFRLGPIDGSPCDTIGLDNHPFANFRWEHEDSTDIRQVTFTDLSAYQPASWRWTFGDGTSSTEQYPIHTYTQNGVYNACLIVKNQYSADTFCQKVYIGVSAQDNPVLQAKIDVWPNPFGERMVVALSTPELRYPVFRLFDLTGRTLQQIPVEYGLTELNTAALPPGAYFWSVEAENEDGLLRRVKTGKVIKTGN